VEGGDHGLCKALVLSRNLPARTESRKSSVRIIGVATENRTEYIRNISHKLTALAK
jgi:hypothetical protein